MIIKDVFCTFVHSLMVNSYATKFHGEVKYLWREIGLNYIMERFA